MRINVGADGLNPPFCCCCSIKKYPEVKFLSYKDRKRILVCIYWIMHICIPILKNWQRVLWAAKILHTGFLHRPWIQGRPCKVLKFHKTENVLELFWKTSGRSWKVWNLPMWNFQQDLMTWWLWELPAIVAIKRVEELLRLLVINKRHARMLQICVFFLKYQ